MVTLCPQDIDLARLFVITPRAHSRVLRGVVGKSYSSPAEGWGKGLYRLVFRQDVVLFDSV